MFTGLVQAVGVVTRVSPRGTGRELVIDSPLRNLQVGESVACNGVCLTVERESAGSAKGGSGAFQVVAGEETLGRTTLNELSPGIRLHLERALQPTDRLGGHLVQGHVDGIGVVRRVDRRPGFIEIEIEAPTSATNFFVEKGSVCVDGVSLTLNTVQQTSFTVGIIPHTAEVTLLGGLRPKSRVNLEIDVIAKLVAKMVQPYLGTPGQSEARLADLLVKQGFAKGIP